MQKEEIPCYIKDLETGDYLSIYMGYCVFGKEIYVDEEDYERAKDCWIRSPLTNPMLRRI